MVCHCNGCRDGNWSLNSDGRLNGYWCGVRYHLMSGLTSGHNCVDLFENRSHLLMKSTIGLNDFADFLDDGSSDCVDHSMGFVHRVGLLMASGLSLEVDLIDVHWTRFGHKSNGNGSLDRFHIHLSQLCRLFMSGDTNHFIRTSAVNGSGQWTRRVMGSTGVGVGVTVR
jgi:hypothetical protein